MQRIDMRLFGRSDLMNRFKAAHQRNKQERQQNHENPTPRHERADKTAHSRSECRRHGHHHASNAHQHADFAFRRLFKNDIEHQRKRDSRARSL